MIKLSPGGTPTRAAHQRAQALQRALRDELPRVREAALAWRNGLAGLLAGLLGFGLIRGRSDVSQLAAPYDAVVGLLLLAALLAGSWGAFRLLWAAHGRPSVTARAALGATADHHEAVRAARALRHGIALAVLSAALLVTAVAFTWYGPAKAKPSLQLTTPAGTVCGTIVRVADGALTLRTDSGETRVDLRTATGIRPADTCPTS
ncbi:hypothetical protein [Nonomuraea sp. SBT364]|uniref:hypothetical protein n=1 Tax=Nonomuraea sp. SBT364 TaxID=1580530 RepID=UPI000AD6D38F|nr:hypothetical protein [Nonomuraea sp. SBT364]